VPHHGRIATAAGIGPYRRGVHALGQVASFGLVAPIPAANLHRALNRTLPPAIRVLETKVVENTFHARHSALAKTYEYRIYRGETCPPFLARYVLACAWKMDVSRLEMAAQAFLGEHDFLSFAATDPDLTTRNLSPTTGQEPATGAVRTIFTSTWEERDNDAGDMLIYRVRGSGFLHHMVRNLVGTMLDVGRRQMNLEDIPQILAAGTEPQPGRPLRRGVCFCIPWSTKRGRMACRIAFESQPAEFAPHPLSLYPATLKQSVWQFFHAIRLFHG